MLTKEDIKIIEIIKHENGGADLVIEISDKFKEIFKQAFGYKRFNKKSFHNFVINTLHNEFTHAKLPKDSDHLCANDKI